MESTPGTRLNILLVEDDLLQSTFFKKILQKEMVDSIEIHSAETLEKGFRHLSTQPIDIILLDLMLPDSKGIDTFNKIHKKAPGLPIIVLSALDEKDFAIQIVEAGAQDYLVKGKISGFLLERSIHYAIKRKESELRLKESEYRLRTLFNSMQTGIIIIDWDTRLIEDVNPVAVQKIGLGKEQIVGQQCHKFVCMYKKKDCPIEEFGEKLENIDSILLTGEKKQIPILQTIIPLRISEKKKLLHSFIDITKIKQAEEARKKNEVLLKEANRQLTETNQQLKQTYMSLVQKEKLASIGSLASGVAHELNTPLGIVNSNFTTLKLYTNKLLSYISTIDNLILEDEENNCIQNDGFIEKYTKTKKTGKIEFIRDDFGGLIYDSSTSIERISNIIESLRNYSQVDFENQIIRYDINKSIEDTLLIINNKISGSCEIEKNFGQVPLIECNGTEINQVLLNIIMNAHEAIQSQNRVEMGTISISTSSEANSVICAITDDGPGIPEDIIHKIFDPFFTTKDVGEGTGLGLNICYDIIVNKHNGKIEVKNNKHKGATFTIILPVTFNVKQK